MKINDLYESELLTDKSKIFRWMMNSFYGFNPNKLTIESDGLVYDGDLVLALYISKLNFQFKSVSGYFDCDGSSLVGLEGFPKIVGNYINCSNTNITSLKFCTKMIGTVFKCRNIKINDPKEYRWALYSEINGTFYSGNNEIDNIINTYGGPNNKKHWAYAINLLSKIKL